MNAEPSPAPQADVTRHAAVNERPEVHIRALATRDSLAALTRMLNASYAELAARGLNFTAATQDLETTRHRCADGQCFVAEVDGHVVGTITACGPYDEREVGNRHEAHWYRDPDIAHLQQFGVDPAFQRRGIGRLLMAEGERWARERGFAQLALDTAEPAAELITMYQRLGYGRVGYMQWPDKTYRSVVMRKRLGESALREHLATMARYNAWATQRLMLSVDAVSEADYRRDLGLFFKSLHGTLNHMLVAEEALWFRRFNGLPTTTNDLALELVADRQLLKQRLLTQGAAWLPWLGEVSEAQLAGSLQYRRVNGEEATLPFSATLAHVFNHGTHHRGQMTAALTALAQPCPELDMTYMLIEEGRS